MFLSSVRASQGAILRQLLWPATVWHLLYIIETKRTEPKILPPFLLSRVIWHHLDIPWIENMACTVSIFKPQDNRMISTPSPSIIPFMPAMVLPEPTYTLPDPNKKPHTRKQRIGHVPRPRNAFILFRCDFVRQKKIPAQVEKDHRNISRIVGQIWRQMNDKQRKPWVSMADEEKIAHSKLYPTYRFATSGSTKKSKRGDDIPHETQKPENQQCWNDSDFLDIHRSSSCPPGNLHVPHSSLESYNGYGAPLKTRDDMGRRPSRVTFYQSHQLPSPPITEAGERRGTFHNDMANEEDPETRFCGPRINFYPYSSNGPQEWDVPTQPYTWTDWSALQSDPLSSSGGSLVSISFLPLTFGLIYIKT